MINTRYKVASYIRLSNEDGDDKESQSVENQRDIIENYIEKNKELELVDEYVDDGYTGGNFDRPDFKRMLADIEKGKINCIITKDLSRFGRDHIDTGYYLERYLPKINVRYIAIGDNVDTKDVSGLQFLSFKLSFNDYYIQDISGKIKSVKHKKMKNGEYQAGIAPYGYMKDTEIKNHLIIDENVAHIVKEIFEMYAYKDMSTVKIAEELNKRNLTPPGIYMKLPIAMRKDSHAPGGKYIWLRTQIGKMLKNEVYIGSVISGKSEQISPKIKKGVKKKKEEFIICPNMHEPIISKELWDLVQQKRNKYSYLNTKKKYEYILEDLVYCKECGSKARFQHYKSKLKNGKVYWEGNFAGCSKKADYRMVCDNTMIGEKIILEKVKEIIKNEFEKISIRENEIKKMYMKAEKECKTRVSLVDTEIVTIKKQIKQCESEFENLYMKKMKQEITRDEFRQLNDTLDEEQRKLENQLEQLENEKQNMLCKKGYDLKQYKQVKQIVKEFLKMENPTKEILNELVERIEFDKQKNIIVKLKFKNPDFKN